MLAALAVMHRVVIHFFRRFLSPGWFGTPLAVGHDLELQNLLPQPPEMTNVCHPSWFHVMLETKLGNSHVEVGLSTNSICSLHGISFHFNPLFCFFVFCFCFCFLVSDSQCSVHTSKLKTDQFLHKLVSQYRIIKRK